jgi:predicted HicB family RNase H-like nuclease
MSEIDQIPPETPKKRIHIKIDESLHRHIKSEASKQGMTLKDYIIAKMKQ